MEVLRGFDTIAIGRQYRVLTQVSRPRTSDGVNARAGDITALRLAKVWREASELGDDDCKSDARNVRSVSGQRPTVVEPK